MASHEKLAKWSLGCKNKLNFSKACAVLRGWFQTSFTLYDKINSLWNDIYFMDGKTFKLLEFCKPDEILKYNSF